MNLVTPVSLLFKNAEDGLDLCSVSESLEARPDLKLGQFPWPIPISHMHFSQPSLDVHLHWADLERQQILEEIYRFKSELSNISFHVSRDHAPAKQNRLGQFMPVGESMEMSTMMKNCEENVNWLRTVFPGKILFENNNYYPTGAYEISTNPTFIARLVTSFADGLLFDLAHAEVSAHNRGISFDEYAEQLVQLPVLQIHLSKPRIVGGGLMLDDHGLPSSAETSKLLNLFGRTTLRQTALTIEHYRDPQGLKDFAASLTRELNS